jgi:hypothetical protein
LCLRGGEGQTCQQDAHPATKVETAAMMDGKRVRRRLGDVSIGLFEFQAHKKPRIALLAALQDDYPRKWTHLQSFSDHIIRFQFSLATESHLP